MRASGAEAKQRAGSPRMTASPWQWGDLEVFTQGKDLV